MDLKDDSNFGLKLFLALAFIVPWTRAEVRSTSACFGTSTDCSYFSLQCDKGHVIRLTALKYGVKDYKCSNGRRRCLDASNDGCCAYNTNDCFESFTANHAYIVYRQCSGQRNCKSLQATRNVLVSCNGAISTYVYIEYECVKDQDIKQFCETTDVAITEAPVIHLQFNPEAQALTTTSHCSCQITAQSNKLDVEYVDVRLFRMFSGGGKSVCSSASLESIPNDDVTSGCSTSQTDDENFVYNTQTVLDESSVYRYRLSDLYKNGETDRPVIVWLRVKDEKGGDVKAVCFQDQDVTSTYFPTTSDPDKPSNTSVLPNTGEDGGNTAAIVAGVLVPIFVILVVGAIVGVVCWRRKQGKRSDSFRGTARRNTYVEEIYDEIGDVPDRNPASAAVQNHTYNAEKAVYDPVYEPGNRIYDPVYEPSNSQNRKLSESENKAKKNDKLLQPVKVLRDQTDKIIAFFRKPESKSNDSTENIQRKRENSDAYDHLKGGKNIKVEVIPPDHQPNHEYSHSKDFQQIPQRSSVGSDLEEPNVLHVGENYLEFKFGELQDADQYNLVTMRQMDPDYKPKPPSRPSPQPSPKLGDALKPNSARSASPSGTNLSPIGFAYDYADNSRKNSNASNMSDHSYKVLEKLGQASNDLPLYDYADLSDREIDGNVSDVGGERVSVYEDVDGKSNQENSGNDIMYDSHGYLAPVTSRRNSPVPSEDGARSQTASFPDLSQLSKEIAMKKLKPVQQESKQTNFDRKNHDPSRSKDKSDTNNIVKSDNTKIKQYDKASPKKAKQTNGADKTRGASDTSDDQVGKGVLKMAKMFENRQNLAPGDTRRGSSDA